MWLNQMDDKLAKAYESIEIRKDIENEYQSFAQ